MNVQLRPARAHDVPAISALVQAGFLAHVAGDWEPPARESFLAETTVERLAPKLAEATICLVAVHGGHVVGVIVLPRPTLVQLLFVAPERLRQGIARSLWNAVRAELAGRHPEVTTVELNASPYAVGAYEALGFFPISQPYRRKGGLATRMACWLPGRAFEEEAATSGRTAPTSGRHGGGFAPSAPLVSGARSPMPAAEFAVSVHDDLPAEASRLVDGGLGDANSAAAPLHDVRPLSCFARAADGTVVGGAVGRTWGLCCELLQLWVSPAARGAGLGSLLVRRFEERAESRGCRTFYLETFSFQAPRLYESLGYESKLAIGGFGPGIVKHVMVRESSAGRRHAPA